MKLSEKQQEFNITMAKFDIWADTLPGYKLRKDEAYRLSRTQRYYLKIGSSKVKVSQHQKRLAEDKILDYKGIYQEGLTEKSRELFRILGEKWESMHPKARWGGRFKVLKKNYDTEIGWDPGHFEFRG